MKTLRTLAAGLIAATALVAQPIDARAGADPFIGEIMVVGFNFCPRGWLLAQGQLLNISDNTALFSLLGTAYGGNGVSTFALPDLRGRMVLNVGQGPGLSNITWGQRAGVENVTLTQNTMPNHTHTATSSLNATDNGATQGEPNSGVVLGGATIYATGAASVPIAAGSVTTTVTATGGNQPFSVQNPYLGMYVCIALEGIYPSRN